MALIDDLRAAAADVDPQFQPTANELSGFVTALAGYVEHGQAFFDAASEGADKLAELLAGGQGESSSDSGDAGSQVGAPSGQQKASASSSKAKG
jgi:hypothetical protein